MKKIISILIVLLLLAIGCGKDNMTVNNKGENTQDTDGSDVNDENGDILNGDSKVPEGDAAEEDENEDDTTKVEEIPFNLQIELPEGTTVGEYIFGATAEGTDGWTLENPNYIIEREYAEFQDRLLWTQTACGWIEDHQDDGSYLEDGGPVLNSEFCVEQKHGEIIKCGHFYEVTFKIFSNETMKAHGITPEYSTTEYWCIVYKKEQTEFTWIFLDKAFFTREQAMAVGDSLPETELKTTINLKTGFQIHVDPIEGYEIKYETQYPEGTPFSIKKDGEEYAIIWGHIKSDTIYYMIMSADSEEEIFEIIEAVHIEFEKQ